MEGLQYMMLVDGPVNVYTLRAQYFTRFVNLYSPVAMLVTTS